MSAVSPPGPELMTEYKSLAVQKEKGIEKDSKNAKMLSSERLELSTFRYLEV